MDNIKRKTNKTIPSEFPSSLHPHRAHGHRDDPTVGRSLLRANDVLTNEGHLPGAVVVGPRALGVVVED